MLGRIKNMKWQYKVGVGVATAAAIAAGGGAAFAYWTTTGSGGGSGTAASSNGTIVLTAHFTSGALTPGGSVPVSITAANPGTTNLYLTSIHNGSISLDATSVANGCLVGDFSLTGVSTTPTEVKAGDTSDAVGSDTLNFANTDVNQDGCKGATITLSYTSS